VSRRSTHFDLLVDRHAAVADDDGGQRRLPCLFIDGVLALCSAA
jgi:hypothetical protein